MSFLDNLRMKLANALFRPQFTEWERQPRVGKYRTKDPESLIKQNKNWVYVCASKNAETCAMVPLRLYAVRGTRRYGSRGLTRSQKQFLSASCKMDMGEAEEIVDGHPLLDLLDGVNPHMSRFTLIEATILWQELVGDAYWYVEKDPGGVPLNLWPLPAQNMRIIPDANNLIAGYAYVKGTTVVPFEPGEIVHTNYFNPTNIWYGLSPLEATFGAANLLDSQQQFEQDLYDNGGIPQVGIIFKQQLSEDQRKRIYAEWRQRFASRKSGDKAIILAGGDDLKTFGYPPKEAGLAESQNFNLELIAAAFGIPMTILKTNQSNLASAEAGWYQYMKGTIQPKLVRLQEILTEQLAKQYDEGLVLAFDDCVPADRNYRLQEIQVRLNTGMTTVNEERAQDGMEPVPWGDEPNRPGGLPMQDAQDDEDDETGQDDSGDQGSEKAAGQLSGLEAAFSQALLPHFVNVTRQVDERLSELA